jgi:CPA1 family monovalent cation:H+ antiporter
MESDVRLRGRAVWDMVVFVLNGLVFILIGLQLSTILGAPSGHSLLALIAYGSLVALAVIVVRLVWMFGAAYITWWLRRSAQRADARPQWAVTFVAGWAGMRGVVSLATALALPLSIPGRDLLIFVTFCVILATLVGQGLTLPLIVRALRVSGDASAERDEQHARTVAAEAAVARIEQLAEQWPGHLPLIDTLRAQYGHRASHLGEHASSDGTATDETVRDAEAELELLEHRQIRRAVIDAERGAILELRGRGSINDEAWRRVERDLDLEELRMEA